MTNTDTITGVYDQEHWYGPVKRNGRLLTPARSQQVINHSPDGFAWGYHGSGPAQLALAILLDAGVQPADALTVYLDFARQFLATLPRKSFAFTLDVAAWAAEKAGS